MVASPDKLVYVYVFIVVVDGHVVVAVHRVPRGFGRIFRQVERRLVVGVLVVVEGVRGRACCDGGSKSEGVL